MQISETTHRIAKIIKGLRAFDWDTPGVPFDSNSLQEVITDTLKLCRERFNNYHIDLILPEREQNDLFFIGRSEQIAQVVLNLLNNAFDAALESDLMWVKVKILSNEEKIQIRVSDSGARIHPQLIENFFEPFYNNNDVR